ncbi:MAG TPA: CHASE4 domain-containing protein, partial [Armatimonadota bacterium]
MSIRTRTLIIIGVIFLALLGVMLLCANLILLGSFVRFEDRQMRANVERVLTVFNYNVSILNKTLGDWAPWDETYRFAADQNPKYITDNLDNATMANLGVDLIVFTDPHGRIIFAKRIDVETKAVLPLPASLLRILQGHPSLLDLRSSSKAVTGILVFPEGAMFVASQQILKNDTTGPAHGRLLMGRFIDDTELAQLRRLVQLPLTLYAADAPDLPEEARTAEAQLTKRHPIAIHRFDRDSIAAYTRLYDVEGRPDLLLQVTSARTFFHFGEQARTYVLLSLLLVGLLFGAVIMVQLERVVLSRITHMRDAVRQIGQGGNFTARLPDAGDAATRDELIGLAGTVNEMLAALETAHQQLLTQEALRESEARYRGLIELSPLAFYLIDGNLCCFTNAAGVTLLGAQKPDDILGHSIEEVVDPAIYGQMQQELTAIIETGQVVRREFTFRRFDGGDIDVEVLSSPFSYTQRSTIQLIVTDISERKRAEAAIQSYQARLRTLAADATLAEDRERRRIAEDLHDHIGQSLVACRLLLGTVKDGIAEESSRTEIEEVRILLEQAVQWTRSLTVDLSPPILYELGLVPAISWLANQFQKRHGIAVLVDDDDTAPPLTPEISTTLF